jgi:DNA anti-recombination protein RmuC
LDAKYELVTLEVLQVAELVQLGNIQVSLNRQSTSQEEILYPKIGGLLEASGKLRLTISQALALESTHIRDALVASLTDFESGWKKSVEETLEKWSSTFANKLNSTILVQLGQIMDRSRAVVTALADLERRIETIPQRVDEQASAILSNLTTSFREGTGAIKSGVSQLIEEFDRGTSTVVEGFAADLGMARETFAREVDNWLTGASDRFASSLANSLKAASAQSASELGNILATIKKAASDVQARFEDITTAYEGFNKQHGRFRAEIKDAAITLHDWHEDAVRTEAKLLHEWTRQFASDFDRLGKELNKLIDKAGREVLDEIQSAAHDRAETATILKEIAHSLRNGATHQASQGKVENRPTKPGA